MIAADPGDVGNHEAPGEPGAGWVRLSTGSADAVAHPERDVVARIDAARIIGAQQDAEQREQREEAESEGDHPDHLR